MKFFRKIGQKLSNLKIDVKHNASNIAVYGGLAGIVLGAGGLIWATVKTVQDKYEKPEQTKKEIVENGLKRYAAPAVAFVAGGVSVVWGYNHKVGEAAALASLASTAITSYTTAREANGDDVIMLNAHTEDVKTFDEDGNEIAVKQTLLTAPKNTFVELFDETTSDFFEESYDHEKGVHTKETVDLNLKIVENIQQKWTDIMRAREGRPVYWNEIRTELGMENVKWGQFAGWRFDPNIPTGDNYIDLRPAVFENRYLGIDNDGYTIFFDPNFDGNVLDYEVND